MNGEITEWRCEECSRLLGTCKDGMICIQIRDHRHIIEIEKGKWIAICPNPKCRYMNIKVLNKCVA